jgi:perosamine synthetase
MPIQLFSPRIRKEAVEAAVEVLNSGWMGTGPKTLAFESAFAEYISAPFCVALSSCTSALHLGLHLLNLDQGSEVITTPLTFISTNHVILYEKLKPVFADIDPVTGNIALDSVSELITEQTGAIMLMHYGGYPCDIDEFYALSHEYSVPIIEDCAHACGATYKGRKIGSCGDIQAFSFQAVKNLPMGEGGALVIRKQEYDTRLRQLRWLGISSDTYQRSKSCQYRWSYDISEVGFKYQMNDIQAAIGLAQLRYLDEDNDYRRKIAEIYRQELSKIPGIRLLEYRKDRLSSYHLFCVLVENRDVLINKLQSESIQTGVHYFRNDRYPMYEEQNLPNTEYFWQRVISLPMHVMLTEEEVYSIVRIIKAGW